MFFTTSMYIFSLGFFDNRGEKTLANKMMMIVAVAVVAVICVAGAVVLLNNNDDKGSDSHTTISVMGSTTVEPLMVSFQEAYEKEKNNVSITVSAQGSGTAAPAIRNGIAEIGMLSRDPSSSESDMTPLIIAGDGVVIIVSKSANVTDLTLEQVAKIYRGEITNWNQVGGANLTIRPIIREDSSGTRECLDTIMAAKLGITVAVLSEKYTSYPMQTTTGAMLTQANNVNGAIGYVNLGALPTLGTTAPNMTAVSIDGIAPSPATVTDGTYEISRNLILITGGTPTGEVKAFLDWIMSPKGQKLVETGGFVPVAPTA